MRLGVLDPSIFDHGEGLLPAERSTVLSRSSSSRCGGPGSRSSQRKRYIRSVMTPGDTYQSRSRRMRAGAIAGLLLELALGRLLGRLAVVDRAGGDFEQRLADRITVDSRPGKRARRRPSAPARRPRGGRPPPDRRASHQRVARVATPGRSSGPGKSRGEEDRFMFIEADLRLSIANREHGAGGLAHDSLGHRAQQDMAQPVRP